MFIKVINEDRMLKLIHNFFENPQTLIIELVQNAVRAKAKNITISTDNGKLSVADDGVGCDSIAPLLTLAESDWSKEIEQNQQPAGWGLFVLYCLSKEVEITSKFGTLKFNTESFLKDAAYRNNVLSLVGTKPKTSAKLPSIFIDPNKKVHYGFRMVATLKNDELERKITSTDDTMLQFFPINIRINGRSIKQVTVGEIGKDYLIKTTYMGNEVFIGTPHCAFTQSIFPKPSINTSCGLSLAVIWYGIPISPDRDVANQPVIINITQGSPITPVLPFRAAIKQDEKFTQFWDFVRQKIVDYCIDQINNNAEVDQGSTPDITISLMRTMEDLATQEELNKLNRFYVIKAQPYYGIGNFFYMDTPSKIVTKEEAVISDDIKVRLVENGKRETLKPRSFSKTNKYVGDCEQIFLPEGVIVQYETRTKSPEWLKIKTRVYKVEIHLPKNGKKYQGNLSWYKAKIVSDIGIDVIGIDRGYGLDATTVYYGKDAADVWEIQNPIVHYLQSDDGDSYETQEAWIESQIREDLQNINNNYSKYDLLEGFQKVSKIKCDNIRNIVINKKKMTVTLRGGKKKILLLA